MSASPWQNGAHISAQSEATCLYPVLGSARIRECFRKLVGSWGGYRQRDVDRPRDIAIADPQALFSVPKFRSVTLEAPVWAERTP